MENIPWWLESLLKRYIPPYMIQLLDQPWILTWVAGAFLCLKIIIVSCLTYWIIKERRKRKQLERDHALLTERYEHLKVTHLQHQTMTTLLLGHKHLPCERQPHQDPPQE